MPDFNLLNRPEYFRTFINEFSFNQSNIYVINGLTSFNEGSSIVFLLLMVTQTAMRQKKVASDIAFLISQIQSGF